MNESTLKITRFGLLKLGTYTVLGKQVPGKKSTG